MASGHLEPHIFINSSRRITLPPKSHCGSLSCKKQTSGLRDAFGLLLIKPNPCNHLTLNDFPIQTLCSIGATRAQTVKTRRTSGATFPAFPCHKTPTLAETCQPPPCLGSSVALCVCGGAWRDRSLATKDFFGSALWVRGSAPLNNPCLTPRA